MQTHYYTNIYNKIREIELAICLQEKLDPASVKMIKKALKKLISQLKLTY